MSTLDEYNAKRHFMRTPEPFGALGETDVDALRFVINYHAAKRAHYDLRLEWNGVLLSWAVPEGPSLDTAHKRLALRTEDHPLDYLGFEGTIPDGEYGAGALRIWDTGTWVPIDSDPDAAFEAGEVKFRLAGQRLTGGWMLKKLPDEDKPWLLLKERDASVVKAYAIDPAPLKTRRLSKPRPPGKVGDLPKRWSPQLPSPIDSPPDFKGWVHEIKFDGYRTIIRKDGDAVKFLTRQGLDWTERYHALIPHVQALDCQTALIDGEVAAQDARGATSLELLQETLSANRDEDLIFYAFDLMHLNGRDLTDAPLLTRKAQLRRLVPADPMCRVQYSDHVTGDGRALFAQACRFGLEGVVSKDGKAPYRQTRTKTWLKAKRFDVATLSIIGFTTKSSSRHVASIILAEDTEDGLTYVGRAGTGLSLQETRDLFQTLKPLTLDRAPVDVPKTPNAHFIAPGQFTAEITYRGRTTKNIIRQAAILGVTSTRPERKAPKRKRLITDRDLANIRLTNPDREMFDGSGTTKLDIALFYARAGDAMLPGLLNRPVTLIRCTTGKEKDCFYQRHGFSGLPDGVETMGDTRDEEFLVIKSPIGFLSLPQFGVIEFHPWDCSVADLEHPDRLTIDLDPGEGTTWATVVSAANDLRTRLASYDMPSFVRMTGGTGVHLVVPMDGTADWADAKRFLKAFAKAAAADNPRLFTANVSKSQRKNRIYVDVNRTQFGTSAVASYSLRARPKFPVAMPLSWHDLSANTPPTEFFRKNALIQLEKTSEHAWSDFEAARVPIPDKAKTKVGLKV
ncbi:MAG: DNA ligase D [Pseudomonadota bacterium]